MMPGAAPSTNRSPEGSPPPDEDVDSCTKPFIEHLEDLRKTILWCAAFLTAGVLIAIPLAPRILGMLKAPLRKAGYDPETFLRVIQVAGGFAIAMRVVVWSGVLLAFPGLVLAVARFVFPGLTHRERNAVTRGLGFAAILFAGGVCMCYYTTLPVAIVMMFRINAWLGVDCRFVELADYVSFVLKLLLAFGIAFELPVVTLILGSLGIVTSRQLREKRRHVIVGLLVMSMFLTPQDPITMLLMAVPLMLLYEVCVWLIEFRERRRAEETAQASPR